MSRAHHELMGDPARGATEPATPRRLAEARRSGHVAPGAALRGAAAQAATFLALVALAPSILGQLAGLFATALSRAPGGGAPGVAARLGFDTGVRVLALPLATAFAVTLAVGLLQTGALWTTAPLRLDLGRLSPLPALRRLWGRQGLVRVGAGLLEIAIVAGVAVLTLRPLLARLVRLAGAPAANALATLGAMARLLGGRVVVAALAMAVVHEVWSRGRHARALRMTRREVSQERRELEGDPVHRAERRRLHGELGAPAAIADVGRADLVITSGGDVPVAVALSYDGAGDRAPVVVARGERVLAAHLLAAAQAARVPIVSDAALAHALRALAEGDEIPAASYDRVAELLRVTHQGGPAAMTHGASGKRA